METPYLPPPPPPGAGTDLPEEIDLPMGELAWVIANSEKARRESSSTRQVRETRQQLRMAIVAWIEGQHHRK